MTSESFDNASLSTAAEKPAEINAEAINECLARSLKNHIEASEYFLIREGTGIAENGRYQFMHSAASSNHTLTCFLHEDGSIDLVDTRLSLGSNRASSEFLSRILAMPGVIRELVHIFNGRSMELSLEEVLTPSDPPPTPFSPAGYIRNFHGQIVDPRTNEPVRYGSPAHREAARRNQIPLGQFDKRR